MGLTMTETIIAGIAAGVLTFCIIQVGSKAWAAVRERKKPKGTWLVGSDPDDEHLWIPMNGRRK